MGDQPTGDAANGLDSSYAGLEEYSDRIINSILNKPENDSLEKVAQDLQDYKQSIINQIRLNNQRPDKPNKFKSWLRQQVLRLKKLLRLKR